MSSMKTEYVIREGTFHANFWRSRAKVQFIGGAFANGKTTAVCMKTIMQVLRCYPGCRVLLARSTKVKLRTTLQREFFKWCPAEWIKSFNKGDGECILTNDSQVDFRYVAQRGNDEGESTSNLLSANYDLIVIDQIEDPELVEKDFDDLMGRLRGDTPYDPPEGEFDPTMPLDGPRWFLATANPTGNWVYDKFVKPIYDLRRGVVNDQLIKDPVSGEPMIELFEGSTYDNAHNLKADYIRGLEATYRGQMRDRYLLGKWASYEGLVYPMVDETIHFVEHEIVRKYFQRYRENRYTLSFIEAYDHGLSSASCYMLGFVDDDHNVIWLDGFHEKEQSIHDSAMRIKAIRLVWGVDGDHVIKADPAIFRRTGTSNAKLVGKPVSGLFREEPYNIRMVRGNNDIASGIGKVGSYLALDKYHSNPFTGVYNSPRCYFSGKLEFVRKEILAYHWKRQKSTGEITDLPNDKKDHAMDTLKYGFTDRPKITELPKSVNEIFPLAHMWFVQQNDNKKQEQLNKTKSARYG